MSPVNKPDVLIVGAGVIGLSLAWELSQRGTRVQVVESQSKPGRQSSWAGAGILPPTARNAAGDAYERLRSISSDLHATWHALLLSSSGIDNGFRRCGGVYLGLTPAEKATLVGNELWWAEHAIPFERLTPDELRAREPNLPHLETGQLAWWLPDECQIRNPRHIQALTQACQNQGVQFLFDREVKSIDREGDLILGIQTNDGQKLSATCYCITSGAWSRQFLDDLDIPSGLMPVRGQMLLYKSHDALISSVVNEGNRYLVPRDDGHLLAGSIEEEVGFVCETTDEGLARIRSWAEGILPALKECPLVQSWAGLRPGSYDGLPYLGALPNCQNAFLAAGHFRSGLHLSTGTAVMLADLICGNAPTVDLAPFRVARG